MLEKRSSAHTFAKAALLAMGVCAFSSPGLAAALDRPVQLALSELKQEELPAKPENGQTTPAQQDGAPAEAPQQPEAQPTEPQKPAEPAPSEAPAEAPTETPAQETAPAAEPDAAGKPTNPAMPNAAEGAEVPKVEYDLGKLPFPVRKMHELILTAAKSGSIEALRPLIGSGDDVTMLSLADIEGDPLAYLKSQAGDPDGQEILAILVDVLESGYVHIDAGTADELYVWPYFFAYPLDKLDAKQKVELFQIVTAGDYDEMKQFGTYVFYRLGITPKGRWRFFVTGD
ncbi:hypothetical protein M8997_021585 [Phyllobacterium sp. 21LDTY02-6]|uniref:hypothetical protein n=1 Tax=Phyllobacterium sp. 21LDTY02-6 TaxID=2944903 RepID=UPI00201FE174|nr:hypothetical protein [Phyllobacterium sp. 21LDTY02-6]MCO4319785.1 hypothetical protein [Phyllobacterium sp. 21LDTY02-6]